jgi:hypothetical protein
MFLADLHIHTRFSDGKLTLPEVVDLYGSRGFGAIAITDHLCESKTWLGQTARLLHQTLTPATFPIYRELLRTEAARAWDQYRMVVLPGFEITQNRVSNDRSSHLLALGVEDFYPADGDIGHIAKGLKARGAVTIAAHPVSTGKIEKQTYGLWHRRHELDSVVDAWEVASGPQLFDEVLRSKFPKVASSDLHRPSQLHAWKTLLDCERHPEAILETLRRREPVKFHFYEAWDLRKALPRKGSDHVSEHFMGRLESSGEPLAVLAATRNLVYPPRKQTSKGDFERLPLGA